MRPGVVEIKDDVVFEPLPETKLRGIVVGLAHTGERRQGAKLRLEEQIVEYCRPTAERTGGASWTVVPKQLQESKVRDVAAAQSRRGEPRISRLGRSQTRIAPEGRLEWKEMFEERDPSN